LAMSFGEQLQILIGVIMVVVVIFELWLLRRRRKTKTIRTFKPEDSDDSYNTITSTERIADIMRNQGVDTEEADDLLRQAKRAQARGEYEVAAARANAAKNSMMTSKRYTASTKVETKPTMDLTALPEPETVDAVEDERPVEQEPVDKTPKLPENFMQAKFMLGTAKESIESARSAGRNTSEAVKALKDAAEQFKSEQYGKALSMALKAKKLAEGLPVTPLKTQEGVQPVTDLSTPAPESVASWKAEVAAQGGKLEHVSEPETLTCPNCETSVTSDDAFCRKCGTKLEFAIICPGCGMELERDDAFCRKCGTKAK
jgi:hypothetical protein